MIIDHLNHRYLVGKQTLSTRQAAALDELAPLIFVLNIGQVNRTLLMVCRADQIFTILETLNNGGATYRRFYSDLLVTKKSVCS